jgi:hypothetical protein
LNDILSGLRDGDKPKNGYKKIVLKEFPSVTTTPVATIRTYDEVPQEDNWCQLHKNPIFQ